ncbi:MAG: GNAT family N-acetyltransferase [Clostridiales bacterium]|nr:GNAT family N-acetyltransferase [Clostridiales bacterium]
MVFELNDTSKVWDLFEGWEETLIYSCLQKVMGKVYVSDTEKPVSAFAFVGCFGFFAGVPDIELVTGKPAGFVIMVPQNEEWAKLIENVYPDARKVTRYAIRKDTIFDRDLLKKNLELLPEGYELKNIDDTVYDSLLDDPVTADFVSAFESKEKYLEEGRGVVILKDGRFVSGASSYTRYKEGIEIEVDTIESERRKNLALISCSALILRCIEEGLYPSWDAHNMGSVHLAEKLGYEFDHEYIAYEVASAERTH